MGRRVFYADPKQPAERAAHSVDFAPAMVLAGERVSDNKVGVAIRDRETGADAAAMFVAGSISVSNNVVTFQTQVGSDNRDYVATVGASTNKERYEEADVVIPVRSRPRKFVAP